ncbi:MAG TPA: hypothetical protein VJC20_00955 [Candidatus Paceibacterota bacterium]
MEILDSQKPALLNALMKYLFDRTDLEVLDGLSEFTLHELNDIRVIVSALINDMALHGKSERLVYLARYNLSQAELLNAGLIDLMKDGHSTLQRYAADPEKGMLMLKALFFLKKRFMQ